MDYYDGWHCVAGCTDPDDPARSAAPAVVQDTFCVIDRKLERRASACHKHNPQAADAYNLARRVLRGEP